MKDTLITWNIDMECYSINELQKLLDVVEQMDTSIAKEISEYIEAKKKDQYSWKGGRE